MKSKTSIVALAALSAVLIITGCAGPEARHDNRVEDRDYRQDDRQGDRYDRRDARW